MSQVDPHVLALLAELATKTTAACEVLEHRIDLHGERLSAIEHLSESRERRAALRDELLDEAWNLIANVADGDWGRADVSSEWKEAAERWRDRYHESLKRRKR